MAAAKISITLNSQKTSTGLQIVLQYCKPVVDCSVQNGNSLCLELGKIKLQDEALVAKYVARMAKGKGVNLLGATLEGASEVDHWVSFSSQLMRNMSEMGRNMKSLEDSLKSRSYLVEDCISLADIMVWSTLKDSAKWKNVASKIGCDHLNRWFNHLSNIQQFKQVSPSSTDQRSQNKKESGGGKKKDVGKFIQLPGASEGNVVTRFPPEAGGYLHIGHAKAALLNNFYKVEFKGKLIMRFDDTNPAKEKVDFEEAILQDVDRLGIKPDIFTFTSDHFELIMQHVERLMQQGHVYADDTNLETMRNQRENRQPSTHRNNNVEKNMEMWTEMKKGSVFGKSCCLRAKIDHASVNGCLRDPVVYRCKAEPHPRHGDKYKVYPTYDFACPIVDSVEGVTHALRTTEYHDRDEQYYWFIEKMAIRKPYIWEYSRLNLQNTVLSKRKLTWFVENKVVSGWDDPRMPTVRGVLRRGMTVQGLKDFIVSQGSSKSNVMMEWDKLWSFNKKVIDPVAPRFTALVSKSIVPVHVVDGKEVSAEANKHPKNPAVGKKEVWYGPNVLIEREDAEHFVVGTDVTFINWGNITITDIIRDDVTDKIAKVVGKLNLENRDYKKTHKVTWLADVSRSKPIRVECIHFDHIITKAILDKEDDFKNFINYDSKKTIEMVGDSCLKDVKEDDIIQLQRKGYYRCDKPARTSIYTCKMEPIVLIYIPDGHSKEMPQSGVKGDKKQAATTSSGSSNKKKQESCGAPVGDGDELFNQVTEQGDLVRKLKTEKADKAKVGEAVKELLRLKGEYKQASGKDYKPGAAPKKEAAVAAQQSSGDCNHEELFNQVTEQGDLVRKLKSEKADKAKVGEAVKELLRLKGEYKQASGKDYKPGAAPKKEANKQQQATQSAAVSSGSHEELFNQVTEQGDLVRKLKSEKAGKPAVDAAVKELLRLKGEYKQASGKDYKPGAAPKKEAAATQSAAVSSGSHEELFNQVTEQGDLVRKFKSEKADKAKVGEAVKELLRLKGEYKQASGKDYKPGAAPKKEENKQQQQQQSTTPTDGGGMEKQQHFDRVSNQGDVVRKLKEEKASKDEITKAVEMLKKLKVDYKEATGADYKPAATTQAAAGRSNKKGKKEAAKPKQQVKKPSEENKSGVKKQTRLGLEASKSVDLADWYSQVLTKGEMIEYYDVSGCYVLRPWSYSIWEKIVAFFDARIKKMGVKNGYFPIFVSQAALEREKEHIADFAPEVAWVTRSGDTELAEPIAIRPTSETVMYPTYAKWVQSHRDLPIRINQWNNVVRWEFKHPQPFLRTREFLWQEGHSAFATKPEAEEEVMEILNHYGDVYEQLLAIPVVRGKKTEKEKFAGGDYTTTVEAFISASGRAIQAATSHHLGQNFSKMFDISFEDPHKAGEKAFAYQNSWGLTTRSIGVLVMVHGDDKGLVLPPRVADIQVVIVPCGVTANMSDEARQLVGDKCDEYARRLQQIAGVRVKADVRSNYSPGWKFNHWELKGVPIRLEVGPRDIKDSQCKVVIRWSGEKMMVQEQDAPSKVEKLLEKIQADMLARATKDLMDNMVVADKWEDFLKYLDQGKIIQAPFCGDKDAEGIIKKESARDEDLVPGAPSMGAKSLCFPFQPLQQLKSGQKCISGNGKDAIAYCLFGRSY